MKRFICQFRPSGNPCFPSHLLLILLLAVPGGCYAISDATPANTTTDSLGGIYIILGCLILGGLILGIICGYALYSNYHQDLGLVRAIFLGICYIYIYIPICIIFCICFPVYLGIFRIFRIFGLVYRGICCICKKRSTYCRRRS